MDAHLLVGLAKARAFNESSALLDANPGFLDGFYPKHDGLKVSDGYTLAARFKTSPVL